MLRAWLTEFGPGPDGSLFPTQPAFRHHRPRRIRTRPRPGQTTGRTPVAGSASLPLVDITGGKDWKDTPLLMPGLAGGFCLRASAQSACSYANICEHCPSFHTEPNSLPILAAQRVDAEALAKDAERRGWITEAERHRRLIDRLDTLINQTQTA